MLKKAVSNRFWRVKMIPTQSQTDWLNLTAQIR